MPVDPFTSGQLLTLRNDWIEDRVDLVANPKVYLSHYNRLGRQLVDDSQLQALKVRAEEDWGEELATAREAKINERLLAGDDQATADTAGDDLRLECVYKLVTAFVFEKALRTSSWMSSLPDGTAGSISRMYAQNIVNYRTFVVKRRRIGQREMYRR